MTQKNTRPTGVGYEDLAMIGGSVDNSPVGATTPSTGAFTDLTYSGTAASFLYLSLYGADAATYDTNGFLFHAAGMTKGSGKLLQDTSTGSTARPVQVFKVKTPDGTRYLPLYSTAACGA